MDEEADAGDYEDHDDGELIHLEIEAGAEIAGDDPVEKFFAEGVAVLRVVIEEFADSFQSTREGNSRGGERDGVDDFIRPLPAEKAVDGRAQQRQQRDDPQMIED